MSASSLAPYYQCSLKWLFERVLDLANVRIETGLMAENIAGQVYHAALNLFFTELKKTNVILSADNAPGLPDAYHALLGRCLEEVFNRFPCLPGNDRPVMSALTARLLRAEQKQFRFRLENCLAVFLSYFAGYRVIGSETVYQTERDSFFLNGTVDCMLEDARDDSKNKGSALIVDFKLKYLPDIADCTGTGENGLANFQLPMYLSLAEENENKKTDTALFFSIVDAEPLVLFGVIENIFTGTSMPKKGDEQITRESGLFGQILNEFCEKAERFAKETSSGKFSVFPVESDKCTGCNYHRVCRTVYKIDREQNSTLWGNINGV